jgi:hypothetical protein
MCYAWGMDSPSRIRKTSLGVRYLRPKEHSHTCSAATRSATTITPSCRRALLTQITLRLNRLSLPYTNGLWPPHAPCRFSGVVGPESSFLAEVVLRAGLTCSRSDPLVLVPERRLNESQILSIRLEQGTLPAQRHLRHQVCHGAHTAAKAKPSVDTLRQHDPSPRGNHPLYMQRTSNPDRSIDPSGSFPPRYPAVSRTLALLLVRAAPCPDTASNH